MRAILVSLCLLMTVLAFAPEASARPCVLDMGTTPNVCVYHFDPDTTCVIAYAGTHPSTSTYVCTNGDGSETRVCAYVGNLAWACT